MIGLLDVDFEITVVCERIGPGCEFRAIAYDKGTEAFYGGSGPTALEAVAWCLDEYVRRGVLQLGPEQARPAHARPGDVVATTPSSPPPPRPRSLTPAPVVIDGPALAAAEGAKDATGCFDTRIPTSPAPRLLGERQREHSAPPKKRRAGGRR